jgi:hypothetical protein
VDVRAPLRQAAVDLHRRQMRSPAHSLGNGAAQTKHGLVLETMYRSVPGLLWSRTISSLADMLGPFHFSWSNLALPCSDEPTVHTTAVRGSLADGERKVGDSEPTYSCSVRPR